MLFIHVCNSHTPLYVRPRNSPLIIFNYVPTTGIWFPFVLLT